MASLINKISGAIAPLKKGAVVDTGLKLKEDDPHQGTVSLDKVPGKIIMCVFHPSSLSVPPKRGERRCADAICVAVSASPAHSRPPAPRTCPATCRTRTSSWPRASRTSTSSVRCPVPSPLTSHRIADVWLRIASLAAAVNDAFCTKAWKKELGAEGSKVHFLADDTGAFTTKVGMIFE